MDRSGILSQAGFAFQMNVFLRQVAGLTSSEVAHYEYLDDISTSTSIDELSGQIGLCDTQLIQVKNTNVSKQDVVQIYTNWILALCERESISSFLLIYSDRKTLSKFFDTITADQFIEQLNIRANRSSRSNAATLESNLSDDEIAGYFSRVKECAHACAVNEEQINTEIRDGLASPFHLTSDVDLFNERVSELKRMIQFNATESMLRAVPYEIDYESFMQLCEQICEKISSKRYEPDYSAWAAAVDDDLLSAKESSREYRQLRSCLKETSFILEHLYYSEYYRSVNYERLARCQASAATNLESVTFDNFRDSCLLLKANAEDSPIKRLLATKDKSNQYAFNEHEKWGSCIWLTREETPAKMKISWKDETNG